jgi:Ca-activated chloride channel family protein
VKVLFTILAAAGLLLAAPFCTAVERVEIVLDASAGMWQHLEGGPPHFIAVREALQNYVAAAVQRQGRPEVALRIVGGGSSLTDGDWCRDTRLLLTFGVIDSASCREVLADLVPSGGLPLVYGLEQAVNDLGDAPDKRRIVIITSGSDQCHGDVIAAIRGILAADPPIEIRIIGLGLDRNLANAATLLAPTRNLFDPAALPDALAWALQPADTRPAVARQVEILLTLGVSPLTSASIELTDPTGSERAYAALENGRAGVQLAPGRYRAEIQVENRPVIELAGLVIGGANQTINLGLSESPPVTLEVDPQEPLAGGTAYIGFWGAPAGTTWVELATPETALGSYLARAAARKGRGEVALDLPDSASELEARFIFEPQPGISQLLGVRRFETQFPRARIESPEKVENGKPITISWTGPGHPGDHIAVTAVADDSSDSAICRPTTRNTGSFTTRAPEEPGDYVISYRSARGTILDRRSLEVFEVLATLGGPDSAAPAEELSIPWTGPDVPQDFISIAFPGADDDEYLRWVPTEEGNPARLRAPSEPGIYEIRYVRSVDSAVLARRVLEVLETEGELLVPKSVAAGTRFHVRWTGTAHPGDYLAVAEVGSRARDSIDFSFATSGGTLTLAAPFEPGQYEVRYISGSDHAVVDAVPLTVH